MPDRCSEANIVVTAAMAEIESAFYDIESLKNAIKEIQYDLSDLDRHLHEITLRLKETQDALGLICPLPGSKTHEDPHKSVPI